MKLFEQKTRNNGKTFYVLNEEHPQYEVVKSWIQACHDDCDILPNNYIYEVCKNICDSIEEFKSETMQDFADGFRSVADCQDKLIELVTKQIFDNWYIYNSEVRKLLCEPIHVIDSLIAALEDEGTLAPKSPDISFSQYISGVMQLTTQRFLMLCPIDAITSEVK